MNPSSTDSDARDPEPIAESGVLLKPDPKLLENLMRVSVVVLGMIAGAICALFAGVVLGWIPFIC